MGLFSFMKNVEQNSAPMGKGRVLAFLNQKGGVGKTTMAFNVAYALAELGKKVLCIDLDPQSNLSLLFCETENELRRGPYHIYHLLVNSVKDLKALHVPVLLSDLIQNKNGVDFLIAGQELSGLELTLAAIHMPRQLVLKKFIELHQLKSHYDYILLDGPPTLGLNVVNIVCAADALLVPFKPDAFSQQGLKSFHQMLQDVAESEVVGQGPKWLAYIPNLVEGRRKFDEDYLKEIGAELESLGGRIFPPIANRMHLSKANHFKKSVFDYQAKDFLELKNEFREVAKYIEESFHE